MADQPTEQSEKSCADDQLSGQELNFLQRWRVLIDRLGGDGGQTRVARRLNWSTSTVSRDYAGITLPTDARVDELADYLKLGMHTRVELGVLLQSARDARRRRRKPGSAAPEPREDPETAAVLDGAIHRVQDRAGSHQPVAASPGTQSSPMTAERGLRIRWIATLVATALVVVAGVLIWRPSATGPVGIRGAYPGEGLKAIAIPVTTLSPPLAAAFRHGRTAGATVITGYEFRNARDDSLCLTAVDTGPTAGHNGDRVELAACNLAANQVWIPQQWETSGASYSHLVSDRYQTMCLNANNIGGLAKSRRTQLWDCYPANNESWSFANWYHNVQPGGHSYPLCLHIDRLCLDADMYSFGEGDRVNIWTQYPNPVQFWS